MELNNCINNLGFEKIPIYLSGGDIALGLNPILGPFWNLYLMYKLYNQKELDKADMSTRKKKSTSKASTKKSNPSSSGNTTVETVLNSPESLLTSTSTTLGTLSGGNGQFDWMSEQYGSTSGDNSGREPFSSIEAVWEDPTLSRIDTGVTSRYLKNNLQLLIDAYHTALANNVGQKRT